MPLNTKGKKIMRSMKATYGSKKGEEVFYASKNKGTIKGVEKASEGKMMNFQKFVRKESGAQVSEKELKNLTNKYLKKLSGAAISEAEMKKIKDNMKTGTKQILSENPISDMAAKKIISKMKKGKMARVKAVKAGLEKASKTHAAQAKTLGTVLKAAGGGLKEATKRLKAQGYKGGSMALKKIPEGPEGAGLRALKAERPDVTSKMGFAKKGKIMKASMGKSVRGYGAARTSGSGLQDEELIPGKSLDYYKDLM